MAAKPDPKFKVIADNRKARFHYAIGETFEAGIALTGSEVKSMRAGKTSIAESYASARDGELWLLNSNISEYKQAGRFNHAPKRPRKLLLHKRQIAKLIGAADAVAGVSGSVVQGLAVVREAYPCVSRGVQG